MAIALPACTLIANLDDHSPSGIGEEAGAAGDSSATNDVGANGDAGPADPDSSVDANTITRVSPAAVLFDASVCGLADAGIQTMSLQNTGSKSITWTATLIGGALSPFTLSPTSGTVPGASEVALTIGAAPVGHDSGIAPLTDDLLIKTSAGTGEEHLIHLALQPVGSAYDFMPSSVTLAKPCVPYSGKCDAGVVAFLNKGTLTGGGLNASPTPNDNGVTLWNLTEPSPGASVLVGVDYQIDASVVHRVVVTSPRSCHDAVITVQ